MTDYDSFSVYVNDYEERGQEFVHYGTYKTYDEAHLIRESLLNGSQPNFVRTVEIRRNRSQKQVRLTLPCRVVYLLVSALQKR